MNKYHQTLISDQTYHLFSRAVGNEKIFRSSENYRFFLEKLQKHTSPICNLYCYSLLPNHFHLLVKIKDEESIVKHFIDYKKTLYRPEIDDLSDFIMERFSNFLNSYTKAYNKVYNRIGSLFMDYMKRSKVSFENDFTKYIWYIHKNAVHHQITKTIGEWSFDSYNLILSNDSSPLLKDEILNWFGNKRAFIDFHAQKIDLKIEILDL